MKFKWMAICIMMILMILSTSACATTVEYEYKNDDPSISMFVLVEEAPTWRIVYHRETKVMYAVSAGASNFGSFTLLVNEEGKPLLWEDK